MKDMRTTTLLYVSLLIFGWPALSFGAGTLLSTSGSGRATAYLESTKIIRHEGKTHVAWLDSSDDGFRVRIRTRDEASGTWSETWTIGEAADNHGGPALVLDGAGYLHVIYYAHHHPVRYRRSVRPNDASEWTEIEKFGKDLTYPAVVCDSDNSLIFTARRSYEDRPWELEMWRRTEEKGWYKVGPIIRTRFPGYAQFAASLAWGPKRERLHLATRIYETIESDTSVPLTTIGYLSSADGGMTWQTSNGESVKLPVSAETIDRIASADGALGRVLSGGSMDVSPEGTPYVLYSERIQGTSHGYLASPQESPGWRQQILNPYLPESVRNQSLYFYGGLGFSETGGLLMVGTLMDLGPTDLAWGDPSMEIVLLYSATGSAPFNGHLVRSPDATMPRWLPNIERRTGFNRVEGWPAVVYMEGERGASLDERMENKVWFFDLDTASKPGGVSGSVKD